MYFCCFNYRTFLADFKDEVRKKLQNVITQFCIIILIFEIWQNDKNKISIKILIAYIFYMLFLQYILCEWAFFKKIVCIFSEEFMLYIFPIIGSPIIKKINFLNHIYIAYDKMWNY